MKIKLFELRRIISEEIKRIRETLEPDLEAQIDELRDEPEFETIESFTQWKLDNDDFRYNFVELQALARNRTQEKVGKFDVTQARQSDIDTIRKELGDFGFEFVGRQPVKSVRGVTSNPHGRHPFAGSGGGGSGFGDGGFTSHGGGPGAIGGGKPWRPGDSRSLPMGSRLKK